MKLGRVVIGRRVVVGSNAALHGPLTVSQGVYVEPLTRPLCGEVMAPECSVWGGVPAVCRFTEEDESSALLPNYDTAGRKFTTIELTI